MKHRLDIVSIGIEEEGGVIAGMVVRPLSGKAIVAAAGGEAGPVEGVDGGSVRGLESEMVAAGELARRLRPVGSRDEQFVIPEMRLRASAKRDFQHLEYRIVEAAAGGEIGDHQLDMVDQPAAVQF